MSETTFPFADQAGLESEPVEEPGRSRRTLLLAGGLAAVVLAGAGYLLLGGGSSSSSPTTALPVAAPQRVLPPAAAVPAKPAVTKLPAPSTARLGRDPFKALYVEPVAATSTTGGPAAAAPAAPAPASGSTAPAAGTSATTAAPYALTLKAISKPSPQARFFTFLVGTKLTNVLPAQRFGKYGELVVLAYTQTSTGTVTGAILQVGDDSPIDLRIGEKVTVL